MKGKIFTPDEANRMLPLVARIADDIVATYADVNHALQGFQAEEARSKTDATREGPLAERNADVATSLDRFQRLIEEVEALGGTLRDYENGSIDFYGELDGEIVYLCWQRGEPHVGHWHALDEGFSKRRQLPLAQVA